MRRKITNSRTVLDNMGKRNADERVKFTHACECENFSHVSHLETFCNEKLGLRKFYTRGRNQILRICNKCAIQTSSSRSRIL